MAAYTLIMVRHGESTWNQDNKFCGWYDADLADTGVEEAKFAGDKIKASGLKFDIAFTSVLKRAIKTLFYIQEGTDLHWVPVVRDWRLNERMYGSLQGLNKAETAAKQGFQMWRRSYDVAPPPVDKKSPHWLGNDPKYKNVNKKLIPKTECPKDTVQRVIPYWNEAIVPELKKGKVVLIVAHGNSLRAMCKHLDNMSDADIMNLNIPTGMPLVYELDKQMKPVNHRFLATDEEVKAAVAKVTAQGKASPQVTAKMASPTEFPLKIDANRNRSLSKIMNEAVRNKNLEAFQSALAQGFDVRSYVRSEKKSETVPFVEKLARSSFSRALRLLLVESNPSSINQNDAYRAFQACLKSGAKASVMSVFIEASIIGTVKVLDLSDCFRYATGCQCKVLARRVVKTQDFNVNSRLHTFDGHWDFPLHVAARLHDYDLSQSLLRRSAIVDSVNSYGATALMIACDQLNRRLVRLYLANGSNPNLAYEGEMSATFLNFGGSQGRGATTDEANDIIYLLIAAGLQSSASKWLQKTAIVTVMSHEAGRALQMLAFRMPMLVELAIIMAREQIRSMMQEGGPSFNELLNDLPLPYMMKQQIELDLVM